MPREGGACRLEVVWLFFMSLSMSNLYSSCACAYVTCSIVVPPIEFYNVFFPYLFCMPLVFVYFFTIYFHRYYCIFISRINVAVFSPWGIKWSFIMFIHRKIILIFLTLILNSNYGSNHGLMAFDYNFSVNVVGLNAFCIFLADRFVETWGIF